MMRTTLPVIGIALFLSACSQNQNSGGDGGGKSDLAGPGTSSDLAPSADLGSYPTYGFVYASNTSNSSSKRHVLVAMIYSQPYMSCTTKTSGGCTLSICQVPEPAKPPYASAGTLTLTGGARTLTLTPNADKSYTTLVDNTQTLWNGGEPLTLTASGADVPAFTTQLTAPTPVVITSPLPPGAGGPISISRASDLQMTWTGGNGKVRGGISVSYASSTASLICVAAASAGSYTLPAAMIAQLPASPMSGILFAYSDAQSQVVSGNYSFLFDAYYDVNGPANAAYFPQIQLN